MMHHGLQTVALLLQVQLQLGDDLHLDARLGGGPVVQGVLVIEVAVIGGSRAMVNSDGVQSIRVHRQCQSD